MGLRGRLEAIRAPTMGKAKKGTETNRSKMERLVTKLLGASACAARVRTKNATLAKNMTKERAASDQASQAAARGLIVSPPGFATKARRARVAPSPLPPLPRRRSRSEERRVGKE